MLSKFSVLALSKLLKTPIRRIGGLTPLEKFEKLRKLCCKSEIAKISEDAEYDLRPKNVDEGPEVPCLECIDGKPHELLDVRCKLALIVGGANGIGYETADELLRAGAEKVIIADIDRCGGLAAVQKLNDTHGDKKACLIMTDIREPSSIEMAFKELYKTFCRLDIYVNTVGIFDETPSKWELMMKTNLIACTRGTILAYQYFSKNAEDDKTDGSVIVNVSSYGSIANVPSMPMFSAAASGIIGLTSSFGQEFHWKDSKVRFVTICPSCTDSGALKNMKSRHYDSSWVGLTNTAMKCCTKQSPKIVAKALVNAIRFGTNGSVYVVKEGKHYKYNPPDYPKYLRQETILL